MHILGGDGVRLVTAVLRVGDEHRTVAAVDDSFGLLNF
jgi:hypothetical protein